MLDAEPQTRAVAVEASASRVDAASEHGAAGTERGATYGLRRFMDVNANLLRMLSVLFAAAGFLHAFPSGEASAILLSLIVAMIFVIYWRLWHDLPLHFGIVPGTAWTTELALFYYLFTITIVVAAYYVAVECFESRRQY